MKTHQGIAKRFKKTNPKKGKPKILHQTKGRGSKHLKTKQSNPRKRRIRRKSTYPQVDGVKRVLPTLRS